MGGGARSSALSSSAGSAAYFGGEEVTYAGGAMDATDRGGDSGMVLSANEP